MEYNLNQFLEDSKLVIPEEFIGMAEELIIKYKKYYDFKLSKKRFWNNINE